MYCFNNNDDKYLIYIFLSWSKITEHQYFHSKGFFSSWNKQRFVWTCVASPPIFSCTMVFTVYQLYKWWSIGLSQSFCELIFVLKNNQCGWYQKKYIYVYIYFLSIKYYSSIVLRYQFFFVCFFSVCFFTIILVPLTWQPNICIFLLPLRIFSYWFYSQERNARQTDMNKSVTFILVSNKTCH